MSQPALDAVTADLSAVEALVDALSADAAPTESELTDLASAVADASASLAVAYNQTSASLRGKAHEVVAASDALRILLKVSAYFKASDAAGVTVAIADELAKAKAYAYSVLSTATAATSLGSVATLPAGASFTNLQGEAQVAVLNDSIYVVDEHRFYVRTASAWAAEGPALSTLQGADDFRKYLGEVASEAAMVALSSAEVGDRARRTDVGAEFVLTALPASSAVNWAQIAERDEDGIEASLSAREARRASGQAITSWASKGATAKRAVGASETAAVDVSVGALDLTGVEVLDPSGLVLESDEDDPAGAGLIATLGAATAATWYALDADMAVGSDRIESAALLAAVPTLQRGQTLVVKRTDQARATKDVGEMLTVKAVDSVAGVVYTEQTALYAGERDATDAVTVAGGYPSASSSVRVVPITRLSMPSALTVQFDRDPLDSVTNTPVGANIVQRTGEAKVHALGTSGNGVSVKGCMALDVTVTGAGVTGPSSAEDGTPVVVVGGRDVRVWLPGATGRHAAASGGTSDLGLAVWRVGGTARGGQPNGILDAHADVLSMLVEPGTIMEGGDVRNTALADGNTVNPGGVTTAAYYTEIPDLIARRMAYGVEVRGASGVTSYLHQLHIGRLRLEECVDGLYVNESETVVVHDLRPGRIEGTLASAHSGGAWSGGSAVNLLSAPVTIHRIHKFSVDVTGGRGVYLGPVTLPAGTRIECDVSCEKIGRTPASANSPSSEASALWALRLNNASVTHIRGKIRAVGLCWPAFLATATTEVDHSAGVEIRRCWYGLGVEGTHARVRVGPGVWEEPLLSGTTNHWGFLQGDAAGATITRLDLSPGLRLVGTQQERMFGRNGAVRLVVGTPAEFPATFDQWCSTGASDVVWVREGTPEAPREVWLYSTPVGHADHAGALAAMPNGTVVSVRSDNFAGAESAAYEKVNGSWVLVRARGTGAWNIPNTTIADPAVTTTITVTGARLGMHATAVYPGIPNGWEVTAEVTALDTVTVTADNISATGADENPDGATVRAVVTR